MKRSRISIWSIFFLLFLCFFFFLRFGFCQDNKSKIDQKDLKCFIQTLSSESFSGRGLDHDGHQKTQEFIINRFKTLQIEPFLPDGYLEKFTLSPNSNGRFTLNNQNDDRQQGEDTGRAGNMIETANVIGFIKGESNQSIIISAHYDHVGTIDSTYFPGADDNASGVAALLELAEEFVQSKHLKYSMIFLATAAEELGLLGASYHVKQSYFKPEKVFCHINIDMISRCDDIHKNCAYLYYIGSDLPETIDSLIRETDTQFAACKFDHSLNKSDIFARSDAQIFKAQGVPSVLFFSGLHADYHQPTDTMDKIDFDIYENRVRLIGEVVKRLQK